MMAGDDHQLGGEDSVLESIKYLHALIDRTKALRVAENIGKCGGSAGMRTCKRKNRYRYGWIFY